MTSLSEQNLVKLAQEEEEQGNLAGAIENLEEALKNDAGKETVIKLSQLYRKNKQEDQAYSLIKTEPDLFSDPKLFKEYCQVLNANNYFIEALQLKNLAQLSLTCQVVPVDLDIQQKIMQDFRQKDQVTQNDYQQLFKLDLINFKTFAQSLLLDPSQGFAIRISLCEDLIKLGVDESVKVFIIGKEDSFIPAETNLLEKSTIYKEVIAGIGDRFRKNPSQLPLMLGETNLVLGSLYPKLSKFISDTDNFTSCFVSYLKNRNGGIYQKLLDKIYQNLPK